MSAEECEVKAIKGMAFGAEEAPEMYSSGIDLRQVGQQQESNSPKIAVNGHHLEN